MAQDSPFRQWEGQYRDAQELMEQLAEEARGGRYISVIK